MSKKKTTLQDTSSFKRQTFKVMFTTMGNKKNHPIGVSVKVPGYAKSKIAMIVRLKKTAR